MRANPTYVTGVCGDLLLAREGVADLERAGFREEDIRIVDVDGSHDVRATGSTIYGRPEGDRIGRGMLVGALLGLVVGFVLLAFVPPGRVGAATGWWLGVICLTIGTIIGALQGWLAGHRGEPRDATRRGAQPSSSAVGAQLLNERPMDTERRFEVVVQCAPDQTDLAVEILTRSACGTAYVSDGAGTTVGRETRVVDHERP